MVPTGLTNSASSPLSAIPVVFPSLFQASSPPELRLIGLDVSVPVFSWHKRSKHRKAQCMNNDAHCSARYTSWENIFITRGRSAGWKKKKKQESPVDLDLSCLAWPLWVNKYSPDLKGSVSQFKFSVLFVHPGIARPGRANSSEQQVCNREAQRFLFTTGLQRDACSFGLHSFVLMLVFISACDNWGIVRFFGDSWGLQQEVRTCRLPADIWGLMIYSPMKHCFSTTA